MEKKRIQQVIVVEGKYDKNHLLQQLDAHIVSLDGFQIFKDKERLALLRTFAQKRGLIILTDGDSAGFLIRNYLKGTLPKEGVYHAYIPDIYGKERRKKAPSKEGKVGVEGVPLDILIKRLESCLPDQSPPPAAPEITAFHFFEDGLSGQANSAGLRQRILAHCALPANMTAKQMLFAFGILYTYEQYREIIQTVRKTDSIYKNNCVSQ